MANVNALDILFDTGILAICRAIPDDRLFLCADALVEAGVKFMEVTFDSAGGPEKTERALSSLSRRYEKELVVGAGTVLTLEQLSRAQNAGARYIVSPNCDLEIIAATKEAGLISVPGALTPTEIVLAYKSGADLIKLFPAGLAGAEYFRAVKEPYKHIPLAAVGNITEKNLVPLYRAGALVFGVSSGIFERDAVEAGDSSRILNRAKRYLEIFKAVKEEVE
ncbi:MAG TPA: bifunctional 4-hydroxy-2-oxoglutarate aldolase/2-dehydro-3-deoxy-phosphogluconate aldolase [Clostridia bacterium]|nr:bifunctional 4-hydroxy-2-oxoglutarate aldolase/2-dehydro-3-deoxy-phosphogluconate aldolase [Clostridia bacterium]